MHELLPEPIILCDIYPRQAIAFPFVDEVSDSHEGQQLSYLFREPRLVVQQISLSHMHPFLLSKPISLVEGLHFVSFHFQVLS
jgi:hypothetical protein